MTWWSWRSFAAGAGIAAAGFAALIIVAAAYGEDPEPYVLEVGGEPLDADAAIAELDARAERSRVLEAEVARHERLLADARGERDTWKRRAERAEARIAELELNLAGTIAESCVVTWRETGECGSLDELIERYNAVVAALEYAETGCLDVLLGGAEQYPIETLIEKCGPALLSLAGGF